MARGAKQHFAVDAAGLTYHAIRSILTHKIHHTATSLLNRQIVVTKTNQVWSGQGRAYLAVVIDLFALKVIG